MFAVAIDIVNILAPGILLALIGFVWFHKGPDFPVPFVTTLVLNVCLPALLFHTLVSTTVELHAMAVLALATLVSQCLFVCVASALLLVAAKDWRQCITLTVGNTGNLGLPLCLLAFGDEGLAYAVTFFAVQCFLLFSIGEMVIAGSFDKRALLRSPVLHSVWLGVAVRILDLPMPQIALNTLQLAGQVVIPLMLITLGVSLAGMRAAQLPVALFWSGLRTLIALLIGVLLSELFDLTGAARGVLIIQTVAPVALFNYLLAVKHGNDSTEVSGMILVTHLGAILYLPPILAFVL